MVDVVLLIKLITFVAFFFTVSLCLCWSLGLSCVVQCYIELQLYVGGWCYCNSAGGLEEASTSRQCLLKLHHLGTKCTLIFTQLDWYNLGYGSHLVALTCVSVGTNGVPLVELPGFDLS